MKFREHRGYLADAMETVIDVADRGALVAHLDAVLKPWGIAVTDSKLTIKPYGYDERIGWNTHIVTMQGYGVLGFTDGAL